MKKAWNVNKKKIITYNVNGIRSAVNKGFIGWLQDCGADIVCLQETKAQPEQIPTMEIAGAGYTTYSLSAQKKGYSGVALLCKQEPDHIEKGAHEILCPSAVFFFPPLWRQMFLIDLPQA